MDKQTRSDGMGLLLNFTYNLENSIITSKLNDFKILRFPKENPNRKHLYEKTFYNFNG